jgi:hypothetical protein
MHGPGKGDREKSRKAFHLSFGKLPFVFVALRSTGSKTSGVFACSSGMVVIHYITSVTCRGCSLLSELALPPHLPLRALSLTDLLTDRSLLWLLGAVLAPTRLPARNTTLKTLGLAHCTSSSIHTPPKTHQIKRTANQMISHTRTILTSATTHKHDAVLLDIVALAGNIGRDTLSCREPHTSCFSLARVGLLGTCNTDFEADAF